MARIAHPNVVHVYEVGEDRESPQGQIFIAMEFVPGSDLVEWQNQHPVRDATSLDHCLRTYLQAAAGLSAAHNSGLIHRDFKPDKLTPVEKWRSRFRFTSANLVEVCGNCELRAPAFLGVGDTVLQLIETDDTAQIDSPDSRAFGRLRHGCQ